MRKLLITPLLALLLTAPASAASVVPIVMKDPGCHWFKVGNKYSLRYVSSGPVTLRNLDVAPLRFVGPTRTRLDGVGKSITISRKGTYHITMLGQAKDDNHLTLVVK
ncbi:MAG TPA: hypothetical protein VEH52_07035 [Gaiellaceae bacterium]|nr:hypothetical protein [Gaiellaceae bacterium]